MENKIKFSHNYKKLNGEKWATLCNVRIIKLEHQTKGFLDYDTEGIYKLPKSGFFMCLLFHGENGTVFTTLRRYTPPKFHYYFDLIDKEFEIISPCYFTPEVSNGK